MTYPADRERLKMANYFQTPNDMIDKIVGRVISGDAAWVVMTVWRYTEGMKDKATGKPRKSALIPTETFKRVLSTDRNNTAYKYVQEAVNSGLISVVKNRGKVSSYSINHACEHWYIDRVVVSKNDIPLVVAESASSVEKRLQDIAESASSVEKRLQDIAESDTPSSVEKRNTYKERDNKEIYKEITISDSDVKDDPTPAKKLSPAKQEREILVKSLFDKWIELSGQKIKPSEKRLSHINARLNDDFTEQQIIDAMTYVATDSWHVANGQNLIEIAVRSTEQLEKKLIKIAALNAQQNNAQGNTHAAYQPANRSNQQQPNQQFDTNTSSGYAAKLDADAAAYFASIDAQRAANPSYQESISEMEGMVQSENENAW